MGETDSQSRPNHDPRLRSSAHVSSLLRVSVSLDALATPTAAAHACPARAATGEAARPTRRATIGILILPAIQDAAETGSA
jgi:hypothetical protein